MNAPHRTSDAQDDLEEVPHVSMDYGFFGERESEEQVSLVLVIRERRHKMTWAMFVLRQGTEFPWIATRAAKFIDQLGHITVTLRCDNESAIGVGGGESHRPAKKEARPFRRDRQWEKVSPNGIIERAVELFAGQARALKAALEFRMGAGVPPVARILCWLVEFAAYLMNRCDIGSDGKTPLQRLHGGKDNTPLFWNRRRFCTCRQSQQEGENGNHDSILECLWRC